MGDRQLHAVVDTVLDSAAIASEAPKGLDVIPVRPPAAPRWWSRCPRCSIPRAAALFHQVCGRGSTSWSSSVRRSASRRPARNPAAVAAHRIWRLERRRAGPAHRDGGRRRRVGSRPPVCGSAPPDTHVAARPEAGCAVNSSRSAPRAAWLSACAAVALATCVAVAGPRWRRRLPRGSRIRRRVRRGDARRGPGHRAHGVRRSLRRVPARRLRTVAHRGPAATSAWTTVRAGAPFAVRAELGTARSSGARPCAVPARIVRREVIRYVAVLFAAATGGVVLLGVTPSRAGTGVGAVLAGAAAAVAFVVLTMREARRTR